VNQSTAAVLEQSTAAVLEGSQYAAFGHGTMVLGVVHLVAPTAQLLPLKTFKSDGTANLSDILRAIYYAVQQGNANVINMSFEMKISSTELRLACVAVLAALLGFCSPKSSSGPRLRLAQTGAVVALSLCAYSCGGGYGSGGPGPPALYSITLNPSTVNGGGTATGQVTLNQLAPSGGASVSLSSNSAAATVPASVTVTAVQASATFTVSTGSVAASTPVTISGSYGGVTKNGDAHRAAREFRRYAGRNVFAHADWHVG
jgi:hypothetical protein